MVARGGGRVATGVRREPAKPKLAAAPTPALSPGHDLFDEARRGQLAYQGVDLAGQAAESVEFEQCTFERTTLAGARLTRGSFVDCAVWHSDWANVRAEKSSMRRALVASSRCTGLHWVDGSLRDVTFQECRMDLSVLRFTSFTDVAFVGCNLTRADFTNADLRGAHFIDCDLTAAQFARVDARGARFTRCELSGAGSVASLAGAVISADDLVPLAHTLAAALGIVIETQ